MKVLIIIPAYNEGATISTVMKLVQNAVPESAILVIDDGSVDNTYEEAKAAGGIVIRLPVNLGIGGAVQTGYKYAVQNGYDITVQVDGDGQHDPGEIPLLIDRLGTSDMVIGSRYIEKKGFQSSVSRQIGIKILRIFLKVLNGVTITDPTSGFRALNKKVIRDFAVNYPIDFPEVEAIQKAVRCGYIVSEVPVKMKERSHGSSSITLGKSVWYMVKVSMALFLGETRKKTL